MAISKEKGVVQVSQLLCRVLEKVWDAAPFPQCSALGIKIMNETKSLENQKAKLAVKDRTEKHSKRKSHKNDANNMCFTYIDANLS